MYGDSDKSKLSSAGMESDRTIQGEAGGGARKGLDSAAYTNPALTNSSGNLETIQTEMKGSNNFMLVDDGRKSTIKAIKNVVPWMANKARSSCTKKMLYKRLPILNWLPKYNSEAAVGDLVAGITVGLTVIPQSLAYSNIAGLPAEYGLYGSFLGCFIYIFFGSCKDVPMGPTAIASLLTFQAINGMGPQSAVLLCFLTGLVEVAMGILGLGFLIDFVSGPVSSGFTSAVALIIVSSQVKDVLAIPAKGNTFLQMWTSIFHHLGETQMWDTVLGIVCIIVLLIMRVIATLKIGPPETTSSSEDICKDTTQNGPTTFQKVMNKTIWLIGTSRNAILVILCGFLGFAVYGDGSPPFRLIGYIPPGLPTMQLPPFGFTNGNGTYIPFGEMVSSLGSGIIVIPLIALLENIAICKAFANGKAVDATQELIAIGLSNIGNSFVQGYPGTGSLSRSAVNNSSGVKTPLGSLYTGLLVVIALLFFTPYFFYIPKASLAAIIIAAVIFMVEVHVVKPIWRSKKSDLIPGLATFIACLVLPLEIGILIGIGLNLLFILYHAARPKISVEKLTSQGGADYLMLTPDRCLIFPSVDYVRNLVTKHSIRQGIPVVIDCTHIYGADYTAATVIETLTQDFVTRDQPLFFYNLKPSVCSIFEGLSPKEFTVFYNEEDIDDLLKSRNNYSSQPLPV